MRPPISKDKLNYFRKNVMKLFHCISRVSTKIRNDLKLSHFNLHIRHIIRKKADFTNYQRFTNDPHVNWMNVVALCQTVDHLAITTTQHGKRKHSNGQPQQTRITFIFYYETNKRSKLDSHTDDHTTKGPQTVIDKQL